VFWTRTCLGRRACFLSSGAQTFADRIFENSFYNVCAAAVDFDERVAGACVRRSRQHLVEHRRNYAWRRELLTQSVT
jgi:hypothetical protein